MINRSNYIIFIKGLSNGINPQAAAAALGPQNGIYGSIPRLPILPTSLPNPSGSQNIQNSNLIRPSSIPMFPPQLLAQLSQAGLPRMANGIPGLNLNQLSAQIAGNQANLNAYKKIASQLSEQKTEAMELTEQKVKVEEIPSNPPSPENSDSV